ncbi:MAG: SCO family protein [Gammaproteobacteria bacterium]|nr:SCO family protein [Gammaproteobacteria bacterium]
MKLFGLFGLIFLLPPMMALGQSDLPGDSVYQVGGHWQNQQAETVELAGLRGKKQVVSMIYTHCEHACPVIVSSMKSIAASLPEQMKHEVGFVLVTFTPSMDTPDVLAEFARRQNLGKDQWSLLRTDDDTIRDLSMVLGVKYERLDNNEVNHSNLVSVLDEQGRLVFQESGALGASRLIVERIVNH